MEGVTPNESGRQAPLFNSPLETGIRALVLLEAMHPRACCLTEMTWFDFLVVHTSDLKGQFEQDAPDSLHPDLPGRVGELYIRRSLVEESLKLMQLNHLIEVQHRGDGIYYIASEDAPSFVDLLQSPYSAKLKVRADFIANQFKGMAITEIEELIIDRFGRWKAEFGIEGTLNI